MADESYNGTDNLTGGPETYGMYYKDDVDLSAYAPQTPKPVDTTKQSYVHGDPMDIHFDNPNWDKLPENQAFTDIFATIVGVIAVAGLILFVVFILWVLHII